MKKTISLVLCLLIVLAPAAILSPDAGAVDYYPKYSGSTVSIADALKSLGYESRYSYRAQIAAANGINNYRGTSAQNTQMLNLLKQGKLIKVTTSTPATSGNCYPVYKGSSVSIVDALKSLGVEYSYSFRTKIAAANSISNYKGTSAQNTQMLNLLKQGKLKKVASTSQTSNKSSSSSSKYYKTYTGKSVSIVDSLKSIGTDSSYAHRARIAKANGITNYKGTSMQNTQMLNLLKSGKLIVAA